MKPSIGLSLEGGFRAAGRGWRGILIYAAAWAAIFVTAILILVLTLLPTGTIRELPEIAKELERVSEQRDNQDPKIAAQTMEEFGKAAGPWAARAWPALAAGVLFLIAAGTWVYCGQMSYLAKLIREGSARVSEFWTGGVRSILPVLGAGFLVTGVFGGTAAAIAGAAILLSGISRVLAGIAGFILFLAALSLWIWAGVRIAFWNLSIIADGLGIAASLKASFRNTRGRWWYTVGFFVVLVLISFAASLGVQGLEWALKKSGGGLGVMAAALSMLLGLGLNLFLNFFQAASSLCFYDGLKSGGETSGPSAVTGSSPPP